MQSKRKIKIKTKRKQLLSMNTVFEHKQTSKTSKTHRFQSISNI